MFVVTTGEIDMAIVIPSSKTYDRQNQKVRDNVIERMEIRSFNVVKDFQVETPVFNEKIFNGWYDSEQLSDIKQRQYQSTSITGGQDFTWYVGVAYMSFKPIYLSVDLKIPIVKNNKYIDKVYTSYKEDENTKEKTPEIFVTASSKKLTGTANATASFNFVGNGEPALTSSVQKKYLNEDTENNKIKYSLQYDYFITTAITGNIVASPTINKADLQSTILNPTVSFDDKYFYISFVDIVGYEQVQIGGKKDGYSTGTSNLQPSSGTLDLTGECVKYIPQKVEITVNGDTIGINLEDKTVYINGETQKKVHSIDGNELMQTSNYLLDNGKNAIETMYGETRKEYERGKETATIRCSIGDYYDYDSGDKVISVDNSTGEMSFKMYDKVIPMIYAADGKDRPMSLYQDGMPKVFQVLGTKIFYDGAVWQELSLQEVDKTKIV